MLNRPQDLTYRFADVAGLLNFVHGLSQWIYTQPDADVRDNLIELLYNTAPKVTPETMVPLYLSLPSDSANWPIKPGSVDGAEAVSMLPTDVKPLSWTGLALLLALEPTSSALSRDDLVFVVQGTRDDLFSILDAIFQLEQSEDVQLTIAPVNPASLGSLRSAPPVGAGASAGNMPGWVGDRLPAYDQPVACLIKVSGLRRFYLLEKTATDPHLRLFYRHTFPPAVPVPPSLQLYVEWGYRYPLPPASFIMDSWQRDKLGLVLLPAPRQGDPLVVSSAVAFRPVLQVARDLRIVDGTVSRALEPLSVQAETKLIDVEMRLKKRPAGETRENEQALRHQIQNDLWRLQRILAREREAGIRRLYLYADDNPQDMDHLRDFVLDNPLVILNEFGYFCGDFHGKAYHAVLLPTEDGSSVVTPDRFPDPPAAGQIFRRDPAWAGQSSGYELYIPRDLELYPPLAPGLEERDDILKHALGMTADYNYEAGRVVVLLWPGADGNLLNFHIPLGSGGFVPLGGVAQAINTHVLAPETVQAVSVQVFENLGEALKPQNISADVLELRKQVISTYRSAWDVARVELDQLLKRGIDAEKVAEAIRERFAEVIKVEGTQLDDWQAFLEQVVTLAQKIEVQANTRDAEFEQKQTALIGTLMTHIEKNHARRLQDKFEKVAQAVQNADSPEKRSEIAAMLESLAAEIRKS
jgi:hypothetical protein